MLLRCPKCGTVLKVEALVNFLTCTSCSHEFAPRTQTESSRRVTLTRAHLKLPQVEDLVVLLVNIASDGVLEHEELQKLTDWLNTNSHLDVPAVRFLVDLMVRICEDGKLAVEEVFEIQLAIERILPKEYRTQVTDARKAAYYDQPASENQLDAIQSFTRNRPAGLTRREASEMLDNLFENPPPSNRQIMLLRFWNRMDLVNSSRHEISEWIDAFTSADHARWLAWSLFKEEYGDDGSQRDPSFVPVGIGERYLERVYSQPF
jgi:hypothetical protein